MYYHSLNEELRRRFGGKVYKLSLSSGCGCPNRDGTLGTRGCLFCDGAGAFAETGDIPAQLQRAKARLHGKEGEGRYIAYFQSFTNTYAPAEYLLAGIGDTLAKWYEAVVLAPQPEALPLTVRLGINGAQAIRDVLLASSETALADQRRGDLTQAFRDVVEAIIAGGGMVGGLGERYTRVAAAHAVHNGLTVLPQTDKFLHGTKVAYGILVQSALLGQDDVLAQLVQAYQHFNLPTTLAALEVDINNRAELDRVIAHTLRPGESIHYLPVTLTPEVLRAAFEKVEYFSR